MVEERGTRFSDLPLVGFEWGSNGPLPISAFAALTSHRDEEMKRLKFFVSFFLPVFIKSRGGGNLESPVKTSNYF